jgi:hypothetical protein
LYSNYILLFGHFHVVKIHMAMRSYSRWHFVYHEYNGIRERILWYYVHKIVAILCSGYILKATYNGKLELAEQNTGKFSSDTRMV